MDKSFETLFKVNQFTSEIYGGTGVAAVRLHKCLLHKGISSKLYHRYHRLSHRTSEIIDERYRSWLWRQVENFAIQYQWRRINSERGIFINPSWFYQSSLSDFCETDIIHLHLVFRWLDLSSFLSSLPLNFPIIWSLHDMHPITGGCQHALDCDKFTTHCYDCPNLKQSSKRDQAWKNFDMKAKLYERLNIHFVGNSTWTTAQAEKSALSKYARSIRTIPLGIDTNDYQPIDRSIAKAALRVNPDDFAIAFACANLSDQNKNLSVLLEAISELAKNHSITLIIFGSGAIPEFNSQVTTLNLGHLSSPHLQSLAYSAADIFVMPSKIESFGLTALESMSCGTPVLAFRTGGIPDLVIHGETGWLADEVGSVESLYQGLDWMLQHPQERLIWGKAARERVEREFTANLMSDRYITLYEELAT
ncbi:MAG: glycosyltransferase [Aphanizomenon gracile PMC627.10]|nr:glycosyltransferase [Aphanizomenon gracile PMC627.10]